MPYTRTIGTTATHQSKGLISLIRHIKRNACTGLDVDINRNIPYVACQHVYMQGYDAEEFISELDKLYSKTRILDKTTIANYLIAEYIYD